MGQTRYFDLTFFDFGDDLNTPLNAQKEIDRFVLIDKQIYGLYNVFGNGVISGWDVQDGGYVEESGISISIDPGIGIIKYIAAQIDVTSGVSFLPSNSTVDIYAVLRDSTTRDRIVDFIASLVDLNNENAIKLARVVTGDNIILSIDNTVKTLIGFEAIIQDEINQHKHTGIPTKINLRNEVKNQLPGSRIEGIDASDVVSGRFDIDRIPIVDHNDLENNGMLTHAALDSFVRTLSQNNTELLGEIASVNLLRSLIFLKYIYNNVDEHSINELILIPGISSNSYIDFISSTCNINLEEGCLSGYPAKTGLFTSVYWQDQLSFFNAYSKNNVVVSGGTVSLSRTGTKVDIVENFESCAVTTETDFSKEIVLLNNHADVVCESADSDKVEGKYSGKFTSSTDTRVIYTKNLKQVNENGESIGRDWTTDFDEMALWVKTNSNSHDSVSFYLVNGDYSENETILQKDLLGPFVLITEDYATSNVDTSMNNFEEILINLEELRTINGKNMNNITKFVIFTDEVDPDFSFFVDNVYVRRTNLVSPHGTIRLRFSSVSEVVFHSLFYDAVVPVGTNASARIKIASSEDLLPRSAYSFPLSSGEIFALNGTAAEIEITLTSTLETVSPVLSSVELRMLVDANFNGFVIDSETEWDRGDFSNVSVQSTSVVNQDELILSNPINIGGYYFGKSDSVSENDSNNKALLGFSGTTMPISPIQSINWNNNPYRKFDNLSSVVREFDKSFLIADTSNNRVLKVDQQGNLIKGFGSSFVVDTKFYPLSAIYNPDSHVLTVVFTKSAVIADISKVVLYVGSSRIDLSATKETLLNNGKSEERVLEILLHEDTWVRLSNVLDDLFVNFETGAFSETIDTSNGHNDKLFGLFGMECFIGDFTYVDFIKHPTYFNILENNNWIVANSSIIDTTSVEDTYSEFPDIASIVEFLPSTEGIVFSSSDILFSDYSSGSVLEFDSRTLIAAGLIEGTTITGGVTAADVLAGETNPSESLLFRANAVDALSSYRGYIMIIDKINNNYRLFYNSPDGLYPSDIDMYPNGNLIISESSFADASGRLTQLDTFGSVRWTYGFGTFSKINNTKVLDDDHLMISL